MQNRSRRSLIDENEEYVSRSAYKLESVAKDLDLSFKRKTVLDVGSSTGGFSDFALKHGAAKVIAVEKGTNQMDQRLRLDPRIELHEKTDIRDFLCADPIDIVLIDVSFISLRQILPALKPLLNSHTQIIAMAKPQFEASDERFMNNGVVKNEKYRRQILSEFEAWLKPRYLIQAKADSKILGVKGNKERFYKLIRSK